MSLIQLNEIKQTMQWIRYSIVVSSNSHGIEEDSSVAVRPVGEHEHGEWSVLHVLQGVPLKFIIVHWRFSVVPKEGTFLNNIHVENTKASNREKNWDEQAVHETDPDLRQDGTVLEMHQILWTGIQVDKLLSRRGLGFGLIAALATLVECNLKVHDGAKDNDLQVWINGGNEHSLCQLRSNVLIPLFVEVWVLTPNWNYIKWSWCILEVGVGHQHDDTSVDECCEKDRSHDQTDLLRLGREANNVNQFDINGSYNNIGHCNENSHHVGQHKSEFDIILVSVAQLILVVITHGNICSFRIQLAITHVITCTSIVVHCFFFVIFSKFLKVIFVNLFGYSVEK